MIFFGKPPVKNQKFSFVKHGAFEDEWMCQERILRIIQKINPNDYYLALAPEKKNLLQEPGNQIMSWIPVKRRFYLEKIKKQVSFSEKKGGVFS